MKSQLDPTPLLSLRYLACVGDTVTAHDTYAAAESFITAYRTTHTAIMQTQLKHGDTWETHASRHWEGDTLPVRSHGSTR